MMHTALGVHVRAARIVVASLAVVAFCGPGISAAGPNSPPHVDTSGVNLQPPYPQTALQNLERGATVLGVAVSAEGRVTRVSLIETSRFNDLDASAISTVLGWKFVPAMKDGSPTEGTTMVKLVFEPPAAPPNSGGAQSAPPPTPSSQPLFPSQMTMGAADQKVEVRDFPIPCRNGAFEGVITMENDAKKGGEMARFTVRLAAGIEAAQFDIHRNGSRLVGAEIGHATNGDWVNGEGYWGSGEMGVPIPISVSWSSGQVIGNGGLVFGEHHVGFGKIPEKLEIATYSGDVAISNARLVCLPERP